MTSAKTGLLAPSSKESLQGGQMNVSKYKNLLKSHKKHFILSVLSIIRNPSVQPNSRRVKIAIFPVFGCTLARRIHIRVTRRLTLDLTLILV